MKKIIIKFGTSSLTNGTRCLSRPQMVDLASQVSRLYEEGNQIVLVSSGAIAAGKEAFPALQDFAAGNQALPIKQMLAAIGQVRLMQTWTELFSIYGVPIAQILLTRADFEDVQRNANICNTFKMLLSHRVIPIVNENDTVSTEEISLGDNDNLSAWVANAIQADLLILLTDQEGLFTADPRLHADASLIQKIELFDDGLHFSAGGSSHPEKLGTGGMNTKIEAARKASQNGTPAIIASFKIPNILIDLYQGKPLGTYICAKPCP